jgi:hypothetical protein
MVPEKMKACCKIQIGAGELFRVNHSVRESLKTICREGQSPGSAGERWSTCTMGDAMLGLKRWRMANEGVARDTIAESIQRLSHTAW